MISNADGDLLAHAKATLRAAAELFDTTTAQGPGTFEWIGREPKADIDMKLNSIILDGLGKTGIPILSEETGGADWRSDHLVWIVDPLDGTLNYVRELGPSAISVCLWQGEGPKFGVILDIRTGKIAWGGRDCGSWAHNELKVSSTDSLAQAVLCTGIPSAFDFGDAKGVARWVHFLSQFGKVRMIGSAASSLLLVAAGRADCYYEEEVRIWDVAGGIALLEGAGGQYTLAAGKMPTSVRLLASNRALAGPLSATGVLGN